MAKVLILLISIFLLNQLVDGVVERDFINPEDFEYYKAIGVQIAKYMCRHFDQLLTDFNITKSDLL